MKLLLIDGAEWTIWRKEDKDALEEYLRTHNCSDKVDSTRHPIHGQRCYVTSDDIEEMKGTGLVPYTIRQGVNDAIYIPAKCAHQVRNLCSNIKIAADFISPEHINDCVDLADEFSSVRGPGDRLQMRSTIIESFRKTFHLFKKMSDDIHA